MTNPFEKLSGSLAVRSAAGPSTVFSPVNSAREQKQPRHTNSFLSSSSGVSCATRGPHRACILCVPLTTRPLGIVSNLFALMVRKRMWHKNKMFAGEVRPALHLDQIIIGLIDLHITTTGTRRHASPQSWICVGADVFENRRSPSTSPRDVDTCTETSTSSFFLFSSFLLEKRQNTQFGHEIYC